MKKNAGRKLLLGVETVRRLSAEKLERVYGGKWPAESAPSFCMSECESLGGTGCTKPSWLCPSATSYLGCP